MTPGLTQILTEMSTKKMFLGSRAQPANKADSLTAICELIVYTVWDPQHQTILFPSTVCYKIGF
jgi:hypothetical protein